MRNAEMMDLLVDAAADVNCRFEGGHTALMAAAYCNAASLRALLAIGGVMVDATNDLNDVRAPALPPPALLSSPWPTDRPDRARTYAYA